MVFLTPTLLLCASSFSYLIRSGAQADRFNLICKLGVRRRGDCPLLLLNDTNYCITQLRSLPQPLTDYFKESFSYNKAVLWESLPEESLCEQTPATPFTDFVSSATGETKAGKRLLLEQAYTKQDPLENCANSFAAFLTEGKHTVALRSNCFLPFLLLH